MDTTAGHLVRHYLYPTETFIYNYLANARRFSPYVLAETALNLESYPIAACSYLIRDDDIQRLKNDLGDRFDTAIRTYLGELAYPGCYEQLVHERRIGLLHAHFATTGFMAIRLKQSTGLPLVTSFYGFDASKLLRTESSVNALKHLFQEGDRFLALGQDMARRLRSIDCPDEKIRILHLGVDLRKIPFRPRGAPEKGERIVLLYCGRLVEKKGISYAIEAFAQLTDRWKALEFRIVGDGALRPDAEALVRRLNLEHRVAFRGALPHVEVLREMAEAHLFVLPSLVAESGDMEGTPTVLLEAQASGLPVVSTRHADIPEVVPDGQSGFLVAERDSRALAERLDHLLAHPDRWSCMGEAGRRHVEQHYNILTQVENLEAIYDELL